MVVVVEVTSMSRNILCTYTHLVEECHRGMSGVKAGGRGFAD